MRIIGEVFISDEGNIFVKVSVYDGRVWFKYFRYIRIIFGIFVVDDNDGFFVFFDFIVFESFNEVIFVVVDFGGIFEMEIFFVSDFVDIVVGGEGVVENLDVIGRFDGVVYGVDDFLFGREVGVGFDVFFYGFVGDGDVRVINDIFFEKEFEEGGGIINFVEIFYDVFVGGFEVSEEGDFVGNGLEVVDGEFDVNGVGDGDEMEDGVGVVIKNGNDGYGVFKGLVGYDVVGVDVFFEEGFDSFIDVFVFGFFVGVFGGVVGRVGESYIESFDGVGYGVGSVYVIVSIIIGVSVVDDVEVLFFVDFVGKVLVVGLESVDNVDGFVISIVVGFDGIIIYYDIRVVDFVYSD